MPARCLPSLDAHVMRPVRSHGAEPGDKGGRCTQHGRQGTPYLNPLAKPSECAGATSEGTVVMGLGHDASLACTNRRCRLCWD